MKKIFIINPNSGSGKGLEIGKLIKQYSLEKQEDYIIHFTNKQNEATNIAEYYKNKNVIIYSVGGDGTINEIINGMAYGNSFLSVIPAGSGNDFIKTVRNYKDKIFDIDLGSVNGRYFINSASIGIDAEISKNVNIMKDLKVPKSQIYNASIIYTLLNFNPYELEMNSVKDVITLIAITNGQFYGGGFKISPDAELNDGLLNLVKAEELSKINIIPVLLKLIKSIHYNDKSVSHELIKNITICSENELICGLDGELIKSNHFDIKVEEKAIHYYNDDNSEIKRLIMSK